MQYEEERLRKEKEREKGNLIYKEVIHLDRPQQTQTDEKGNLAQIKDTIMHKISEGVEAVKEMIHDATAPTGVEPT